MAVVGGQFQAIPAKLASSGGDYILLKKNSIQTGTEAHLAFVDKSSQVIAKSLSASTALIEIH